MANNKRAKRSRNSKNFVAIPFDDSVALGALANAILVKEALIGTNFTEDFFCISVDLSGIVTGLTGGEGIPLEMGLNHSDYSVAEVNQNLDVTLTGPGSKIENEQAGRLVRRTAQGFEHAVGNTTEIPLIGRFGSRISRTKCRFLVSSGKALEVWIKNRSGSTLTTGASLRFSGTIYGRWIV